MLQSASLTRQQRNDARHVGFELNPGLFGVVLCKMFISFTQCFRVPYRKTWHTCDYYA